ncbi:dihydroneopterin aldolase [Azospira sp. I09]|uniref:dihydroneopterin aldolase n=1 Tax=Azospira sp. I09 TaxID=1765049 RepID=UPI0012A36E1F|nr:dihydroneopterin aldolase [Azospira sp. I09]BBN90498.1 7,8-dihydroneopterin aldolase [Azospira sp. I09]
MRTVVSVQGLQIYGYHGLCDEERSLGQKFLFTIRCQLADVRSHLDDRLDHSVGYDVLARDVSGISESKKFRTLEALAETIARALLVAHPAIETIEVHVSKVSPPMAHHVDSATVAVTLARSEL